MVIGKPITFDAYYDAFEAATGDEQAKLVQRLGDQVRQSVGQLLHRAALLEAPTEPTQLNEEKR